jgi:C_GCAxxG_C_C family probable redox protein
MCRMSTAFSGGLGGTHEELCGALSGGAMIIGALHGRTDAAASADRCRALVTRYRSQFESVFGATICSELRATRYGGGKTPCAVLVAEAAAVLLNVLADDELD